MTHVLLQTVCLPSPTFTTRWITTYSCGDEPTSAWHCLFRTSSFILPNTSTTRWIIASSWWATFLAQDFEFAPFEGFNCFYTFHFPCSSFKEPLVLHLLVVEHLVCIHYNHFYRLDLLPFVPIYHMVWAIFLSQGFVSTFDFIPRGCRIETKNIIVVVIEVVGQQSQTETDSSCILSNLTNSTTEAATKKERSHWQLEPTPSQPSLGSLANSSLHSLAYYRPSVRGKSSLNTR